MNIDIHHSSYHLSPHARCPMWKHAESAKFPKALTQIATAGALARALAGCNDTAAQHAAPIRPVLVAAVHYEAQARDRSFVGTVRPRIESDLGFRVHAARHARRSRSQAASRAGGGGKARRERRARTSSR